LSYVKRCKVPKVRGLSAEENLVLTSFFTETSFGALL